MVCIKKYKSLFFEKGIKKFFFLEKDNWLIISMMGIFVGSVSSSLLTVVLIIICIKLRKQDYLKQKFETKVTQKNTKCPKNVNHILNMPAI